MKIHDAAIRGDVDAVLAELKSGVSVDVRELASGRSALELVCALPDASTEMVRLLLSAGAQSRPAVLKAAVTSGSIGTITQLLSAGVGIDAADENGQYGSLVYAAYGRSSAENTTLIPVLEFLLANGAEIDKAHSCGETALRIVSKHGRFDAVRLLLDWGANREVLYWSELMHAVIMGTAIEVEALLAEGASLTDRDGCRRTPWLLSLQIGDLDKIRLLLAAGADRSDVGDCGETPLIIYLEGGQCFGANNNMFANSYRYALELDRLRWIRL